MTGIMTEISADMRRCIDNCMNCHATCEATLSYCLAKEGTQSDRSQMLMLLDCAEICRTSAGFLLRGSELHQQACETCATICRQCADWCDRMPQDTVMHHCAVACRECAASCAEMAMMH